MKKAFSVVLALLMVLSVCTFASAEGKDYSGYTIRIYSNSNSTERATWLENAAKAAGFTISLDDNSVISGDTAAIQAANENKDGDIIFGLNETRWSQLVNGTYENLKVMDWTPTWADEVGEYKYDGKAYGLVIQNVLMLYRTDELGTNGEKLTAQITAALGEGAKLEDVDAAEPFYIAADSPAIRACIDTYNEVTGENATPFTMGGGTYARHFPYAVSFGPEHEDVKLPEFGGPMHGANEAAPIDKLLEAVKIYILALLRLEEIDF